MKTIGYEYIESEDDIYCNLCGSSFCDGLKNCDICGEDTDCIIW